MLLPQLRERVTQLRALLIVHPAPGYNAVVSGREIFQLPLYNINSKISDMRHKAVARGGSIILENFHSLSHGSVAPMPW